MKKECKECKILEPILYAWKDIKYIRFTGEYTPIMYNAIKEVASKFMEVEDRLYCPKCKRVLHTVRPVDNLQIIAFKHKKKYYVCTACGLMFFSEQSIKEYKERG